MCDTITQPINTNAKPTGTLAYDMSGGKRHNARHNKPVLREDATEQRRLLRWLVAQEARIEESGAEGDQKALATRGVPTDLESFYGVATPTPAQRAAHSRALRRLEELGLIILPRATRKGEKRPAAKYARLTPAGRTEAARRTEKERLDGLQRRAESVEVQRAFKDAGVPYPPVFIAAGEAVPVLKSFDALQRDTKALRALIEKRAPNSPALSRLTDLVATIKAAEDKYANSLMGIGSTDQASTLKARVESTAEKFQEVLTRLEAELQSILNANHS